MKSKDLNEDVEDVLVDDDLEAAEDAKQSTHNTYIFTHIVKASDIFQLNEPIVLA